MNFYPDTVLSSMSNPAGREDTNGAVTKLDSRVSQIFIVNWLP